jgi:hypothetical protein
MYGVPLNENPTMTTKDEDEDEYEDDDEDKEEGFQFQLEIQGPRGKMGKEWEGRMLPFISTLVLLSYLFFPFLTLLTLSTLLASYSSSFSSFPRLIVKQGGGERVAVLLADGEKEKGKGTQSLVSDMGI